MFKPYVIGIIMLNESTGFDIVGPEDKLNPLIFYLEPLLAFRKKCESLNIDLPFLFHAGETLGDGDSVDQNLYDAILLGTKRIGHAFSLIKHPTLMQLCRERNICCEVCPVR
jgi:adenosine deaminase CECR1